MSRCILTLILAHTLPAGADTLAADSPVRGGAAQRTRVHTQLTSELREFQHTPSALDDHARPVLGLLGWHQVVLDAVAEGAGKALYG